MGSVTPTSKVTELPTVGVLLACPLVMVNPLLWNLMARFEYNTRTISRLCGGPRLGVVVLAACILSMNFVRTLFFHYMAEKDTVRLEFLENVGGLCVGYLLVGVGGFLVLSSVWSLGFYNTFLGDYFGILLDTRVTGFPFNVVEDPMYWGAFLIYVGDAIRYASGVALLLSLLIGLSYAVAAKLEEPFTAKIYAQKTAKKAT